jgi:hypothetical protein
MITIRIFDVSKFEVETEFDFNLDEEVMKHLLQDIQSLDYNCGVKAKIDFLEISNFERFYDWIVKKLYPGYIIIDCQRGQIKGTPDFNVIKDEKDVRWGDKINP